ncbi:MAG: NADH:ubiquinone oxidoreductase subunit N, partial [Gammaproteobacteria bacterium]
MTVDETNFLPALPEIWVFSMACVILVMDLFLSKQTRLATYILSQATLVGAIVLTLQGMSTSMGPTFHDMFIHDTLSDLLKLATYLIIFFVFVYSREYLQARDMYRGEYFVLGLFGVVGMMIMASARH